MRTLREVLLHETKAYKYVKIYDGGWLVGMTYIDDEDLFIHSLDRDFLNQEVEDIRLVEDRDFNATIYEVNLK